MNVLRLSPNLKFRYATLFLLLPVMIVSFCFAQPATIDQAKRAKIDTTLRIATEQVKRGYYQQAQSQLDTLQASDEFSAYISESQQQRINTLLTEITTALEQRSRISQALQQSDVLASQEDYQEAMQLLGEIKNSPYASEQERKMLQDSYDQMAAKYKEQQANQKWQSLFDASLAAYNEGRLGQARRGFEQVAASGVMVEGPDSPQYYIEIIDAKIKQTEELTPAAQELVPLVESDVQGQTTAQPLLPVEGAADMTAVNDDIEPMDILIDVDKRTADAASQQAQGQTSSYLEVVRRKRLVQLDYTTAIVQDAIEKAQAALSSQEFDQARSALRRALSTVEKNKMLLGDVVYADYMAQLTNLEQKVNEAQQQYDQDTEAQRRVEADQLNEQIRQTMDQERAAAVENYMDRAYAFQAEQRYEEALGQLEQLLAIDPLNQRALILKQTLEHTVLYIKQRQLNEESYREEISVMMQAKEKSIPYSDEINYPRNWKEISERRDEMLKKGMAPEDIAVNELLDSTVDLSRMTEDTSFEEAIQILRESVDPPLRIVPLWPDLSANAFIEKDTPVGVDGEVLRDISLRTGLSRVLDSVGSGGFAEISYVIQEGTVVIATVDALPDTFVTEIYDVSDLLNPPANFDENNGGMSGRGGMGGTSGGMGGGMGGMGGGMGGGMMGGMGGMGGGMGGMGGGMGGMGGGMGGMGGGMGGMGGGMMGGGIGNWRSMYRGYMLINTIQQTVEPDTWYDEGGEGRIDQYSESKLIIYQSPEVHEQIKELLDKLREGLGQQIAIEARFLTVTENFLEDIGLDTNIQLIDVFGLATTVTQDSYEHTSQTTTGISGSWGGTIGTSNPSMGAEFSYSKLDDLQVEFILRATEAHRNSKQLSAPRAVVLNGESATMSVQTQKSIVTNVDITSETIAVGDTPFNNLTIDRTIDEIETGVQLSITPVISADKKYVILRVVTYLNEFLADTEETTTLTSPTFGDISEKYTLPTTQNTSIQTRVNVPDRGTVMLGGLTLTGSREIESGAPILSKLPILGRLFSNRSEIDDKQMLLILVKPTIILQEEAEADAVGALASK